MRQHLRDFRSHGCHQCRLGPINLDLPNILGIEITDAIAQKTRHCLHLWHGFVVSLILLAFWGHYSQFAVLAYPV